MELREQLRLRDQEMSANVTEPPTIPSTATEAAPDVEPNTPDADPSTATESSDAESVADSQDDESSKTF